MLTWFSSPLQRYVFVGTLAAWCLCELFNTLVIGRPRLAKFRQDRGSYWLIALAIYLSAFLTIAIRESNLGLLPTLFQWLGIVLIGLGTLLRAWAVLSLGRAFTVVVHINPGQHLITTGPYRWVRHPAYTGVLLTLSGFGLGLGTWLGAILAIGLALIGLVYRVHVEERALLAAFGAEYRTYMEHTGRFFPRLQ
jgi:protein-S-isoprenylcysteine O-methyltransferase Ste14